MKEDGLFFPELSYKITGLLFDVHNEIGRFGREKQYSDLIENKFISLNIPHKRENRVGESGNILDFIVDDKIILEIKAKQIITKDDFYQTQRYLQSTNKKLGLIVNFRNRYLKPVRIVKIETAAKNRFV